MGLEVVNDVAARPVLFLVIEPPPVWSVVIHHVNRGIALLAQCICVCECVYVCECACVCECVRMHVCVYVTESVCV